MSGLSENTSGIDHYVTLKDHYQEPKNSRKKNPIEEQFNQLIKNFAENSRLNISKRSITDVSIADSSFQNMIDHQNPEIEIPKPRMA